MNIHVVTFAQLADRLGTGHVSLDLPDGATVGDALDRLAERFEDIATLRKALAVAVNHSYANTGQRLSEGDELALIPPVSGG